MSNQGELYGNSWILYHVLGRMMGNQELVAIRRKLVLVKEQIGDNRNTHFDSIFTVSAAEGVDVLGSDIDCMFIDKYIVGWNHLRDSSLIKEIKIKTNALGKLRRNLHASIKMSDQGELYGDFWILYTILDRLVGSQEIVEIKRKLTLVEEQCNSAGRPLNDVIFTGSAAEGVEMLGSDRDCMLVDNRVLVVCPDQNTSTTPDVADKTVFVMRDANSRPGYVHLELVKFGTMGSPAMVLSIVSVGNLHYISSDIYKRMITNRISVEFKMPIDTHGPASTVLNDQSKFGVDTDYAHSFRCSMWPKEADEWLNRPRLHDWPGKSLIHQIVQGGCYLVPVGDKTSSDAFLQWRISFVTAERKLIHSISRVQFLVYCLLKYLLKQISGRLKQLYGDADIISSYIIKTILFHALELTPKSFWQEKNTFLCFFLCLKILISWVKTAHCPNYFISKNNMFLGKVHGKNQEKLLHYLVDLHGMTWGCLSIGSHFKPSIGECIRDVKHGELEIDIASPTRLERERDLITVAKTMAPSLDESSSGLLTLLSKLLCNSESDTDEYTAYYGMARALTYEGMKSFEKHSSRRGNKDKYKCLRRSKKYITPLTSACCSPGLLRLATYHYQTGDYIKTLKMCEQVISSCRIL
ncbi:uncharacterized protein [Argopecten irradians]|uniref:uncharacterized protein n=1 Tax=Argopecten irradians TaxID=31199 RepID=UPI00371A9A97